MSGNHNVQTILESRIQELKKQKIETALFLAIEKPIDFCNFFKLTIYQLEKLINSPNYISYSIQKKKGGSRIIDDFNLD